MCAIRAGKNLVFLKVECEDVAVAVGTTRIQKTDPHKVFIEIILAAGIFLVDEVARKGRLQH